MQLGERWNGHPAEPKRFQKSKTPNWQPANNSPNQIGRKKSHLQPAWKTVQFCADLLVARSRSVRNRSFRRWESQRSQWVFINKELMLVDLSLLLVIIPCNHDWQQRPFSNWLFRSWSALPAAIPTSRDKANPNNQDVLQISTGLRNSPLLIAGFPRIGFSGDGQATLFSNAARKSAGRFCDEFLRAEWPFPSTKL